MPVLNEDNLKRALHEGQIVPYFHPLISLRTEEITGFEVLARWAHPQYGLIQPDRFIPLAERAGLINQVTEALLKQISVTASGWLQGLTLSVNISPLQLEDASFPDRICGAAQRGNLSLSRLTLEVTESAQLEDFAVARCVAEELKNLGIRLALDDFGTGYSNLRYLYCLPFDELKIDRSFVRSVLHEWKSRKIVASIIGLARDLFLTSVAEGVEGWEQADLLRALGCDVGQGGIYDQPRPEEEVSRDLSHKVLARPPFCLGD